MSSAAITFDVGKVLGLAKLMNSVCLSQDDREDLLNSLAHQLEDAAAARFATKRDPDGNPWRELTEAYRNSLAKTHPEVRPPLEVSGDLRKSLDSQVTADHALVGATKIYAAVHQFGWPERNIPARPYLGVGTGDARELVAITKNFIAERFRGAS